MKLKFKIVVFIIFLLIVGLLIFLSLLSSPENINLDKLDDGVFKIERGQGVKSISQQLFDAGLIKNKKAFEFYVWFKKLDGSIKAGDYRFSEPESLRDVVETLTGKNYIQSDRSITIIEGWHNREIDNYLASQGILKAGEFLEEVERLTPKKIGQHDFLSSDIKSLEGYLFPDTYRISENASAEEIIDKMLDNFNKKLSQEFRDEIISQGKSLQEVIILASIIEKEVFRNEDKKNVASIFLNRINNSMRLQSCATVNYVTGTGSTRLTAIDLEVDSPYNTYRFNGLPPGSICNPSISSIEAVIYPTQNDYLFFLTTPDNQTIFSRTYNEHLRAKNKYY